MKITNVPKGDIFAIDNTTSYPKLKLQVGYIDIRDGIVNTTNLDHEATIMTMEETAEIFKVSMEELEEVLVTHEKQQVREPKHLFSPQDLQDLRTATAKQIEEDIALTQKLYNDKLADIADYPTIDLLEVTSQDVTTYYPKDPLDLSNMNDPTIHLINQELKFRGQTKSIGRYDEFHSIEVYHRGLIPRPFSEQQLQTFISQQTKKALTTMFRPAHLDKYSFQLECKLLDLFKDGTLTMEQVVEKSIDDCSM